MGRRHQWDGWQRCKRCGAIRLLVRPRDPHWRDPWNGEGLGTLRGYIQPDGTRTKNAGPCEPVKMEKEAASDG